jgi:hypothetical protein
MTIPENTKSELFNNIRKSFNDSRYQDRPQKFTVNLDNGKELVLNLHRSSGSQPAILKTVNTDHEVEVRFPVVTQLDRNIFTALDCIFNLLPRRLSFMPDQNPVESHKVDLTGDKIEYLRYSRIENGRMIIYPYEKSKKPILQFSTPQSLETVC